MLLCCLVGGVVFLCFSMGVLNLGAEIEWNDRLQQLNAQGNELTEEKKQKELDIAGLEKEINELETEAADKENLLEGIKNTGVEAEGEKKKEELKRFNAELEKLLKRIEEKEIELAAIKRTYEKPDDQKKQETELEAEIKKMKDELNTLAKNIREKEAKLAKIPPLPDDSLGVNIEKLKKDMAEAEKKRKELEEKLRKKKGGSIPDIPGLSKFKSPLYIECKDNFVLIHPKKKVLTIYDLNKSALFSEASYGHDIIVFLVRPDGFKVFNKCLEEAEKGNLLHTYEPIESDFVLNFKE